MTTDLPKILGIDAATHLGYGFGRPGEKPISGSFRCAGLGASHPAIFAGAGRWLTRFIQEYRPDVIYIEAPLPGSHVQGQTNIKTATVLQGIPAVLEFMAFNLQVYDLHRAVLSSIRKHFIGKGGMKGDAAKRLVAQKCLALGWVNRDDDDTSFDRTDALAVWSYACHQVAPTAAQPVDDLFVKAEQRRREAEERAAALAAKPSLLMEKF